MTRQKKIFIIGGLILLVQLGLLHPFWGHVRVSGQACTGCPNLVVLDGVGSLYLWAITPYHLRKFDLNYSGLVAIEDYPCTEWDIMCTDVYIIKGEIVDKKKDNGGPWYPVFRIDDWREEIGDWIIKAGFLIQIILLLILLRLTKNKVRFITGIGITFVITLWCIILAVVIRSVW